MMAAERSSRTRTIAVAWWAVAIAVSVAASTLSAANGRPPEVFLPIGISAAIYGTVGAVVFLRRPENRIGALLVALSIVPASLVVARYLFPVLVPINVAFGYQANALLLAYIVLSFPSGRLPDRSARWAMATAVAAGLLGGLAELVTVEPRVSLPPSTCMPCINNPVRLFDPSLYPLLQDVNATLFLFIAAAVVVVVVRRWLRSRGLARAALTPILVGGVAIAAADAAFFLLALTLEIELPLSGQFLLLLRLLIPIGLAVALLRFYAARATVARALVTMGRATSPDALQLALRKSLGDPEMTVLRWATSASSYVDGDGRVVDITRPGRNRSAMVVNRDGEPLAAVLHDESLESDRELLQVVAETVRHALDVSDLRDELSARGGDVARLPQGEVTFLFGDVERSTELLNRLGDAYAGVLAIMRAYIRQAAEANRGEVVDMRADECFLAFAEPADALAAAVDLQRRLHAAAWPSQVTIRLRMGLHSGHPQLTADGYVGIDVHRAARVMASAGGGQVLASEAFAGAIRDALPEGVTVVPLGSFSLRGMPDEDTLYEVKYTP